ncbi:DUF86 domain-containing protein [Candidatus Uhrbacteria bacterium]|nr:DUF86 domain-containing protein [Candidatus Uhrbacteria bacterium]
MSTVQVIENKLSAIQKYLTILERYKIAHGYEHIDYDVVIDVLHNKLRDVERFAERMREYCRA